MAQPLGVDGSSYQGPICHSQIVPAVESVSDQNNIDMMKIVLGNKGGVLWVVCQHIQPLLDPALIQTIDASSELIW